MAPNEGARLRGELDKLRGGLREELTLLFPPWVTSVMLFVILWAVATWLGRSLFDVDFGWRSSWALRLWA